MIRATTFFALFVTGAHLFADFEKLKEGVFLEDFEDGSLDDWEYDLDSSIEITELPDSKALFIQQAGETITTLDKYEAVAIELDMRGAGSIRFGRYEVTLTSYFGCTLEVRDRSEGKAGLLTKQKKPLKLVKDIRVKIVAAGALFRVALNGRVAFEKFDASGGKSAVTLVAGKNGTLFDNVKLSTVLAPEDGATARPDPEKPLVFSTEADAILELQAANHTRCDLELIAAVRHFSGEPIAGVALEKPSGTIVEFGVGRFFLIKTQPENTINSEAVLLKAGTNGLKQINLGKLPEGFFMLDITITSAEKQVSLRQWPISIQKKIEPAELKKPTIPIGVYTKLMQFRRKTEPVWWKTYMHAIAYDLQKHHINTVIAAGAFEPPTINIFNRYGIAVLQRGDQHLNHPGILGTLLGDEPKADEITELKQTYASLHKKTDKPVLTCMVGDGIGISTGGALEFWKQIQPRVRLFRWYGIKKNFYGILNHAVYKGGLPFSSILRIVQASSETPYWVVLPAFGTTGHEAYFQNPTAAQLKGMMHLSLAHGAKGILLFSYQGFGKFVGMVNPIHLKPMDGKLAAAGEVAAKIVRLAKLVHSLKRGGLDIRCPSPAVEAIPLTDASGNQYVYAVNKNTRAKVETRLMLWAARWNWTEAKDLFANSDLKIKNQDGYLVISLSMKPGEGKLISTDAKPD